MKHKGDHHQSDNGSFNDGRRDKLLDRINHFSIHDSTLPQYHDRIGRDLNCACASRHSLLCELAMKFRAFTLPQYHDRGIGRT